MSEVGNAPESKVDESLAPQAPAQVLYNQQHYVVKTAMEAGVLRHQMISKMQKLYFDFINELDRVFALKSVQRQQAQFRLDEGSMWLEKAILALPMFLEDELKAELAKKEAERLEKEARLRSETLQTTPSSELPVEPTPLMPAEPEELKCGS